ncbi:hypothetical protein GCM10020254_57930 [Streptomyces goshikiensis]
MVVGDDDAVDVGDREAEGAEAGDQGVPGGRVVPSGVDEDGAAPGVEDVDEGVPEGVVGDGDLDAPHASAVVGDVRRHVLGSSCGASCGMRGSLSEPGRDRAAGSR